MSSPWPTETSGPLPALTASGIFLAMSAHSIGTSLTTMFSCSALNFSISFGTRTGAAPPVQPFQKLMVTLGPS